MTGFMKTTSSLCTKTAPFDFTTPIGLNIAANDEKNRQRKAREEDRRVEQ